MRLHCPIPTLLTLTVALGVLAIQPAQLVAQEDCRLVGCNSAWTDQSDELPGLGSATPILVGAVVVVAALVAWRLLRSSPANPEGSPDAATNQALRSSVTNRTVDGPALDTFLPLVSPGWSSSASPAVSCHERPRVCLDLPLVGLRLAR